MENDFEIWNGTKIPQPAVLLQRRFSVDNQKKLPIYIICWYNWGEIQHKTVNKVALNGWWGRVS